MPYATLLAELSANDLPAPVKMFGRDVGVLRAAHWHSPIEADADAPNPGRSDDGRTKKCATRTRCERLLSVGLEHVVEIEESSQPSLREAKALLRWLPYALRLAMQRGAEAQNELVAHSGPLRFGLTARAGDWVWWIAVSPRSYLKVPISGEDLVGRGSAHGLLPQVGAGVWAARSARACGAFFDELREPDRARGVVSSSP